MKIKASRILISTVILVSYCVYIALAQPLRVEVLATGLQNPWALAFIDNGKILVTERPGRLRIIDTEGNMSKPLVGLPEIYAVGQGGLLDVVTDRDFKNNRRIYFCYAEADKTGNNSTALASAQLAKDNLGLENVQVLFSQKPKAAGGYHFGCRIAQTDDGSLFLGLGDRFHRMHDAQKLDNHNGKIVRIQTDGKAHPSNPFLNNKDAMPEIWSLGHRNIQSATIGLDQQLWTIEHGPQGGDEINRPEAGKNYGWPIITYGENYGGGVIGEGITKKTGLEQPLHYWTPSIAPSGMTFIRGERYGSDWKGNLLLGSLKFRYLARLKLDGAKVVSEERILEDLKQRIRDVREGPDGFIYILTDETNGQLLKLLPSQ